MIWFSKEDRIPLQSNFSSHEFACKGKDCGCENIWHDPLLSYYLQQIRDHFGKPVYITSGYRCPTHNLAIGGSKQSYHTRGEAADFYIPDEDPREIAAFAESIGVLGIGCYDDDHGSFVHIDTRRIKYFWQNESGNAVESFHNHMVVPEKTAKLYAVTKQSEGSKVETDLFDPGVGNYSSEGVKMTVSSDGIRFQSEPGWRILKITGIDT